MKLNTFSFYFGLIAMALLFSVTACNNQSDGISSDTNIDSEKDVFEIWSDTIVKSKYEDGNIAEIWGYRPNDSLLHYERKFYRNGGIWIEGTAYGEIRHGKWKAYDENGNLISMGSYKMGKGEGVKTVWHSNGKKFYEGEIHNGERVGVWEFYDENGTKFKEIDYSQLKH